MGYSHYYSWAPEHPEFIANFGRLVVDAKRIAEASGVALGNWDGVESPDFQEGFISLNGSAALDEDYETFAIDARVPHAPAEDAERWEFSLWEDYRQKGFRWTGVKTAERPYDLVVTAILLRAVQLMPQSFSIDSDGRFNEEWLPARALVQKLFGDTSGALTEATLDGPPCVRVKVA